MHTIRRLYSKEFDFPALGQPERKSIMLATLPRSGSTTFAINMWRAGCLGAPMEYANFQIMEQLFNRLESHDWIDYWAKVKSIRTGPNGVFSYKMFPNNFLYIARNHKEVLKELSPSYVVYLTRENALEQAISLYRASKSKSWFAGVTPKEGVDYDTNEIASTIRRINAWKNSWENVFSLTKVLVFRVTYERFLLERNNVMSEIATFVGEKLDDKLFLDIPDIDVQRDGTTKDWVSRYRNESFDCDTSSPIVKVSPDFEFIPG